MKINKILAAGVAATLAVTSLSAVAGAEIGTSATTREFSLVHSRGKITYSAEVVSGKPVDVKPIETYFGFKKEAVQEGVEKPSWDYAVKNIQIDADNSNDNYALYDAFIPFIVDGISPDFTKKGGKIKIQIIGTKYDNGNTKAVGADVTYELQKADYITDLGAATLNADQRSKLYVLPIYSGLSEYKAFNPGEYNSIDRIIITMEGADTVDYTTYLRNEYENLIKTDDNNKTWISVVDGTINPATKPEGTRIGYNKAGSTKAWASVKLATKVITTTGVNTVFFSAEKVNGVTTVANADKTAYTKLKGVAGQVPEAKKATDTINKTDVELVNAAIDAAKASNTALVAGTPAGANATTTAAGAAAGALAAVTTATNYQTADNALATIGAYVGAAKADAVAAAFEADARFIKMVKAYNEALAGVEISKTGSGRTGMINKAPELFKKFEGLFGDGYMVNWRAKEKTLESRYAFMPVTDGLWGNAADRTLVRDEIIELSDTRAWNSNSDTNGFGDWLDTIDWENQTYNYDAAGDYNKGTLPEGFAGLASQIADFFNKRLNGKVTFVFAKYTAPVNNSQWVNGGIPSTEVGIKNIISTMEAKDFALFINYNATTGSLQAQTAIDVTEGSVTFDITDILDALDGHTIGVIQDVYYGLSGVNTVWDTYGNGRAGLLVEKVILSYDEAAAAEAATDTAAAVDTPVTEDETEDTAAVADEDDDDDDDDDAAIIADDDDDDDDDENAAVISDDDDDDVAGDVDIVSPAGADTNPATGVGLAVIPAIVAAAAMAISKKRK